MGGETMPNYMPSANKGMTDMEIFYFVLSVIILLALVIGVLYLIFRNPFRYPYFSYSFDVSGKRNIDINNSIDTFLCSTKNWQAIRDHRLLIVQWKKDSIAAIQNSKISKYRMKQFESTIDDDRAFRFSLVRYQTRYKQRNYIKTSYKVPMVVAEYTIGWTQLQSRYAQLAAIDFACTLQEYHSKNQRKLMKPELKLKIKIRDNYTCQICGKYMPDEVGLHIDHIIPIVKGGKSIPSNLRVLCSKCNGSKGAKIEQ